VIIGFSKHPVTLSEAEGASNNSSKTLYDYPNIKGAPIEIKVSNINPYLIDAPNIVLPSRSKPPKGMPAMTKGSQPTDGGHLILSPTERTKLLAKYPLLAPYIKPFIGGRELINNLERYCLWFADAGVKQLAEIAKIPEIKQRIEGVKAARLKSPTKSVNEYAEQPYIFTQNRQPKSTFVAVPEVSSERRKYIPMAFLDGSKIVPSNLIYMIPSVGLYEFGILNSESHQNWIRVIAGRMKSDIRYSPNVYQLFPWPKVDKKQKEQIEKLAQKILDARETEFVKDPETSLADLYDPDLMPSKLRKAHQALDKAVDKLYHPAGKVFKTALERVNHLFELYSKLTN